MENNEELKKLITELITIQSEFNKKFGVNDIYTNSKFFEILIADSLNHQLIPGHSGSRDARDKLGEYEYKHYKETSCNHTWTFNDFSDTTIQKLNDIQAVIFVHIDDTKDMPIFDWCYIVPGKIICKYLKEKTVLIKNTRKMINVGPNQIETIIGIKKTLIKPVKNGSYTSFLLRIFNTAKEIERLVNTTNILTSNKLWEILVGIKLNHQVISEQTQFDARDDKGNFYEYKISRDYSFSFEDISENVLQKLLMVKKIVLASVDKEKLEVRAIYEAEPSKVVERLREKLNDMKYRYENKGKQLRRLQVSLSKSDLGVIGAVKIV